MHEVGEAVDEQLLYKRLQAGGAVVVALDDGDQGVRLPWLRSLQCGHLDRDGEGDLWIKESSLIEGGVHEVTVVMIGGRKDVPGLGEGLSSTSCKHHLVRADVPVFGDVCDPAGSHLLVTKVVDPDAAHDVGIKYEFDVVVVSLFLLRLDGCWCIRDPAALLTLLRILADDDGVIMIRLRFGNEIRIRDSDEANRLLADVE